MQWRLASIAPRVVERLERMSVEDLRDVARKAATWAVGTAGLDDRSVTDALDVLRGTHAPR